MTIEYTPIPLYAMNTPTMYEKRYATTLFIPYMKKLNFFIYNALTTLITLFNKSVNEIILNGNSSAFVFNISNDR